jgi:hypothetical protein
MTGKLIEMVQYQVLQQAEHIWVPNTSFKFPQQIYMCIGVIHFAFVLLPHFWFQTKYHFSFIIDLFFSYLAVVFRHYQ